MIRKNNYYKLFKILYSFILFFSLYAKENSWKDLIIPIYKSPDAPQPKLWHSIKIKYIIFNKPMKVPQGEKSLYKNPQTIVEALYERNLLLKVLNLERFIYLSYDPEGKLKKKYIDSYKAATEVKIDLPPSKNKKLLGYIKYDGIDMAIISMEEMEAEKWKLIYSVVPFVKTKDGVRLILDYLENLKITRIYFYITDYPKAFFQNLTQEEKRIISLDE